MEMDTVNHAAMMEVVRDTAATLVDLTENRTRFVAAAMKANPFGNPFAEGNLFGDVLVRIDKAMTYLANQIVVASSLLNIEIEEEGKE